jgi:hypothetical protein
MSVFGALFFRGIVIFVFCLILGGTSFFITFNCIKSYVKFDIKRQYSKNGQVLKESVKRKTAKELRYIRKNIKELK